MIIQFFIHHQDKSLQSRIEIYQTIDGDHGRDNRAGSRNLKDKEDLAIEHDIAAPVNAESKDQNKIQLKLKYLKEDVNSMLAITSVPLAARDFRRLKPVVSKVNNYSDEFCPEGGENLEGIFKVNLPLLKKTVHLLNHLSVTHGGVVQVGGWWEPKHCTARAKVAIIIPFRNRDQQLKIFLRHMHPLLQRQLLSYKVFVVEQTGKTKFNKGAIYNIGFQETLNIGSFDCYIFHDVDLLAENDLNYYGCSDTPRHMSPAIDKFHYKLPYPTIFGGVEAMTKEEFQSINGFSNIYWGWGGEDDDLYTRVVYKGYKISRPSLEVGRYTMNHDDHFRSDPLNIDNEKMYRDPKSRLARIGKDGLNSLHKLNYTKDVHEHLLYTKIAIDLKKVIYF